MHSCCKTPWRETFYQGSKFFNVEYTIKCRIFTPTVAFAFIPLLEVREPCSLVREISRDLPEKGEMEKGIAR